VRCGKFTSVLYLNDTIYGGHEDEVEDNEDDHQDDFSLPLPDLPAEKSVGRKKGSGSDGGNQNPPPYTPDRSADKDTSLSLLT
jgi:hypothetical protein